MKKRKLLFFHPSLWCCFVLSCCNEGSFISISAQSHHSHKACSSPGLRMSVYCLRDGPLCMCCLRMDAGRDAETDLLMYLLSGMSEIGQI